VRAAVISAIAELSSVGLGQLLARSAEHRQRLRSERNAATCDLLAAIAHTFASADSGAGAGPGTRLGDTYMMARAKLTDAACRLILLACSS